MFKSLVRLATVLVGAQIIKSINIRDIAQEALDTVLLQSRKPVAIVLAGIVSIIFFCGGSFIAIVDSTRQFDTTGVVQATATLWTGVGLALFFAVTYIWIFMVAWPGAKRQMKRKMEIKEQKNEGLSLDQAISAFIMEYVDERKTAQKDRREVEKAKAARRREEEHPRGFA